MGAVHTGFKHDFTHMGEAIGLAKQAGLLGEVPIGAVVVDEYGCIIGRGANAVESKKSQLFHAEMVALQAATEALGRWRLEGCTLYVTLQPCLMCSGMAALSRVERMVWATDSPLYGVRLDTLVLNPVYTKHVKFFSTGVMHDEAEDVLKQFFKRRRADE